MIIIPSVSTVINNTYGMSQHTVWGDILKTTYKCESERSSPYCTTSVLNLFIVHRFFFQNSKLVVQSLVIQK